LIILYTIIVIEWGMKMKLELFDFIDNTLKLIDDRSEMLHKIAMELEHFFTNSFFINDHFLNVNYRIKSPDSLKEKILRYNLYMKYETSESLIESLSDLIGFRIECRFLEDEEKIYKSILKLFNMPSEEGYFSNPLNSNIKLKLVDDQPQIQKNGFEIYKIDGRYLKDEIVVNFELQIKAMVNVFWGDIDHRVFYKNFNYMLTEDFFKDIMSSIKDNLAMIDRQLMLVYNHLTSMDASGNETRRSQFSALLSKIIHDIYIVKVKQDLGFVLDFKKSTDMIVDHIFTINDLEKTEVYGDYLIKILNRLNEIGREEVVFNSYIEFERNIVLEDIYQKKIADILLNVINKDFRWNLFFKIIFDLRPGDNDTDFEKFISFLNFRLFSRIKNSIDEKDISDGAKDEILKHIKDLVINVFEKDADVELINSSSIDKLNDNIINSLSLIENYNDWINKKNELLKIITNYGN